MGEHYFRHKHAGRSSRLMLDAGGILEDIGLKKGDVFLDVGCGDGYFSVAAAGIVGAGGQVYAVDTDDQALRKLESEAEEKGLKNIIVVRADVTRELSLPEVSADVCLMANVMHGFAANMETDEVLKQVARVLKKGGRLAIVEFKKTYTLHGPPLEIRLSPDDIEKMTSKFSFKKTQVVEVSPSHYLIMLVREKEEL